MIDLKGQKALVTGGTRGIGLAIATELARHGADVAVNYLRNRRAAEEAEAQIAKASGGRKPLVFKCNVAKEDEIEEMFQSIRKQWDCLDILISNAASGILKRAMELTKHHWDWTMDINAAALLPLVQRAVPMMEGRKGKIIGTSSLGSMRAFDYYPAVGASKAAMESLIRHLSVELAPRGIRCNVVNAGVVDTDALKHFPNREEMIEKSLRNTPAGRLVEPQDVAKVVVFLCSDYAEMIHGHTLIVDGGFSIKI